MLQLPMSIMSYSAKQQQFSHVRKSQSFFFFFFFSFLWIFFFVFFFLQQYNIEFCFHLWAPHCTTTSANQFNNNSKIGFTQIHQFLLSSCHAAATSSCFYQCNYHKDKKHNNNRNNNNNNKFTAELLCKQTAKTESCLWRALKAVVITAANS